MMDRLHRRWLVSGGASVLALALLAYDPPRASAQENAAAAPAETDAGAPDATADDIEEAALLGEEELDELVAPVALFPDALLAQVLVAATYPLDVVKAERWVEENTEMPEADREAAAGAEGWDPSVAVLAAGFPTVVTGMAADLDQTELLGDAMLTQTDDVLAAVQRKRAQADAMGNLPTNEAQTVTVEGDNITIAPTNPEVVYVPTYDSQAVYTTRASEAPVVVDSSSDGFSTGALVTTGLLSFGAGMLVNEIFDDDDDWYGYWGPRYRPVGWGGGYFRPYPRRGGIGNDIDVNFNRNNIIGNRVDIDRDGNWRPDRERRDRAKNKIADRRGVGGDRLGRPNRPDGGRADLKRRLDAKGGGRDGLTKLKQQKRDSGQVAAKLGQKKGGGKLAQRKTGGRDTALGKKGNLTSAKKAANRGNASAAKAGLAKRKAGGGGGLRPKAGGNARPKFGGGGGGGKKIARPKGGGKPMAKRKGGGKGSAFGKGGRKGGGKARGGGLKRR